MSKQIISEEFKRMQRLAGIITESQLDEKKEPQDEIDYDALRKYISRPNDKEALATLAQSKGKKLALGDFYAIHPSVGEMEQLADTLKKLGIGIYDESWANVMDHPQNIVKLDKYFISKNFITLDQLKKMPDVASTIANNIKSNPTTWNQEIYNKVEAGKKLTNGSLGDIIRELSVGG